MCHNFQVVLIGDHKQLRPVVKNTRVKKLGMAKSSFECHFELHRKHAVMLDTQYRMVRVQNRLTPSPVAQCRGVKCLFRYRGNHTAWCICQSFYRGQSRF